MTLFIAAIAMQSAPLSIVSKLPMEPNNRHYVGNRAPLAPNAMVKLPVGTVRAKGWLRVYLERQKEGVNGKLRELSPWLEKEGSAWYAKDGNGKWGWEEVPYWLKGYIVLAYQMEDQAMISEAESWIEAALSNARPDGDFGANLKFEDGTRDYWANMLMVNCLQSYYEVTGDKRVIELLTNYYKHIQTVPDEKYLTGYWQKMRGGDQIANIYWLYNRTGDAFLLDVAAKTHRRTADWTQEGTLPNWHNVNVAQSFDEPAIYYQQSKDPAHLKFAYKNFDVMRDLYGDVPGGMFGADENARPGRRDPRQAVETCGLVEQMYSDEELVRITGDTSWADHAEEIAFNSYPAAMMPDMKGLRYLTSPNMALSDAQTHSPGIENGGPMLAMNPLSHRCCQHNHSHGWPFYADHLWMASNDNGLVAVLHSASEVTAKVGDGAAATLKADTNYPYEESIRYTVSLDQASAKFPVYLRIPEWANGAVVKVGSETIKAPAGSKGYFKLDRTWKSGDKFELHLPMKIEVKRWAQNKDSASVYYGPLGFSLKIGEKLVKVEQTKSAVWDARWREDVDLAKWPAFEIHPTSPWNYAIDLEDSSFEVVRRPWPKSNFPFTHDENPISLRAVGRKLPEWGFDRFRLVAELQDSPVNTSSPAEQIELIPMGAARLRISAFPVYGANGIKWETPPVPHDYEITASHVWEMDDMIAAADKIEPKSSGDQIVPRMTWWPRKGSEEWLAYKFKAPKSLERVRIYWFDDTGHGQCRVPANWKVQAKEGNTWVTLAEGGKGSLDKYDEARFAKQSVSEIRLVVNLQEGFSGGVLEMRVD